MNQVILSGRISSQPKGSVGEDQKLKVVNTAIIVDKYGNGISTDGNTSFIPLTFFKESVMKRVIKLNKGDFIEIMGNLSFDPKKGPNGTLSCIVYQINNVIRKSSKSEPNSGNLEKENVEGKSSTPDEEKKSSVIPEEEFDDVF